MTDPLEVLRCVGGFEFAAIAGAILAARLARTPGAAGRFRLHHRGGGAVGARPPRRSTTA